MSERVLDNGGSDIEGSEKTRVEQLINIADAGIKRQYKGWRIQYKGWRAFGYTAYESYTFDEQIEAIRELGNSKDQKALEYLGRLNDTQEKSEGSRGVGHSYAWVEGEFSHPNARGDLYKALSIWYWDDDISVYYHHGVFKGDNETYESVERHRIATSELWKALRKLEESLDKSKDSGKDN